MPKIVVMREYCRLPDGTFVPVFGPRQAPAFPAAEIRSRIHSPARCVLGALAAIVGILIVVAWYGLPGAIRGRSDARGRIASARAGTVDVSGGAVPAAHSIVVLPFADLGPGRNAGYLCDGLTEELIDALTQVKGLRVVSRTTAFHFKGTAEDVRKIGAELNVRMALEGSVRSDGRRLRITAQLVDTSDGCHLWSQTLNGEVKDVLGVQQEIARAIVAPLRARLGTSRLVARPRFAYEFD